MAAFERVSRVNIPTLDKNIEIDVRTATLPFKRPPMDDFDPREHRQPSSEITPAMAYFNLIRTSFGAGMLGIPMAISQAGIILGPIMTILVGLLVIHTHGMLLWCLNEISRQLRITQISYRYGFRMALLHGPPSLHHIAGCGPTLVAVFMILSQLGICSVFVILTADNVKDVSATYLHFMMDFQNIVPALLTLYIPYMVIEILMKTLQIVSYVSMIGNVMQGIGMVLVMYLILDDPHGEVVYVADTPIAFLLAIGMMLFNMSAVGVVLTCEKALKNPKIMTSRFGVIPVGIMAPTLSSCIFGTLGYWSFGSMEENVLRSLPYDSWVSIVTFAVYMVAVALVYPIQCYPAIQIAVDVFKNNDPRVVPDQSTVRILEYISRPLFVTATFLIAYCIPFQASFVAFVGNLCTTILSLVFPALMEIGLQYPDSYGPFKLYLFKDLLIAAGGLILWVFGVGLCGYHIYILLLVLKSPNAADHV